MMELALPRFLTEVSFNMIVFIWIGVALILFPFLLKITAPYGRHTKANWGLMINNSWGWFIMEIPSLLLVLFFVLKNGDLSNNLVILASILWVSHYFHRAIIFPFRIHTKGKKMPVIVMSFAFVFNLINGSLNGYWLANFVPNFSFEGLNLIRFVFGIFLFIFGYLVNQYHDRLLIRLRKSRTNGYQIPQGAWFKYVSCPNFLGEIIEWAGFAILCWSLPALAFFIWTMVNLIPRALDHHKWYKTNFNEYPKNRKALIPQVL